MSEYVGISITCFTDVGLENVTYASVSGGCLASCMRWEKKIDN